MATPAARTEIKSARWIALTLWVLLLVVPAWLFLPGLFEALGHDYAADVDTPLSPHARKHFGYFQAHLETPFDGYGASEVLAPGFQIVALSHMAAGLLNVHYAEPSLSPEVEPLLHEVVARARSPLVSPYKRDPAQVRQLGEHGLYLSHLNFILGTFQLAAQSDLGARRRELDALHKRISTHLATLSLRDGDYHLRSFPKSAKWPADQAVTLASLRLYDAAHGTDLSAAPIRGWLETMRRHTDDSTGLPLSSITRTLPYAHLPRGCALSWTVLYMAQFAPDEAGTLYERYRTHHTADVLGFRGFREWPQGVSRKADIDSGPIVFGAGMAATGIGVGPARLFRDVHTYAGIMKTASTVGLPRGFSTRSYIARLRSSGKPSSSTEKPHVSGLMPPRFRRIRNR